MKDIARHEYFHSIPSRKKDIWKEKEIIRKRRISLTFRKMIGVTKENKKTKEPSSTNETIEAIEENSKKQKNV